MILCESYIKSKHNNPYIYSEYFLQQCNNQNHIYNNLIQSYMILSESYIIKSKDNNKKKIN
jgi:hypothetical protein